MGAIACSRILRPCTLTGVYKYLSVPPFPPEGQHSTPSSPEDHIGPSASAFYISKHTTFKTFGRSPQPPSNNDVWRRQRDDAQRKRNRCIRHGCRRGIRDNTTKRA